MGVGMRIDLTVDVDVEVSSSLFSSMFIVIWPYGHEWGGRGPMHKKLHGFGSGVTNMSHATENIFIISEPHLCYVTCKEKTYSFCRALYVRKMPREFELSRLTCAHLTQTVDDIVRGYPSHRQRNFVPSGTKLLNLVALQSCTGQIRAVENCLTSACYTEILIDHERNLSSATESVIWLSLLLCQVGSFLEVRILDNLLHKGNDPGNSHLNMGIDILELIATSWNRPPSRPPLPLWSSPLLPKSNLNRNLLLFWNSFSNTETYEDKRIHRHAFQDLILRLFDQT